MQKVAQNSVKCNFYSFHALTYHLMINAQCHKLLIGKSFNILVINAKRCKYVQNVRNIRYLYFMISFFSNLTVTDKMYSGVCHPGHYYESIKTLFIKIGKKLGLSVGTYIHSLHI